MNQDLVAGIETGGTKLLARICTLDGDPIAEGRWTTATPEQALADLLPFLTQLPDGTRLAAIGMAAFGPLIVDPASDHYGKVLATPKPGWSGSNLRSSIERQLGVPVVVDTDVNAAAIAEQRSGAGVGMASLAYITVGTGIGCGLAVDGQGLRGALHPEAGHLQLVRRAGDDIPSVCSFHPHCAEGLTSGPAVRRRLGEGRALSDDPATVELVADYLGQLGAAIVLAWSPHRIVWGGGVVTAATMVPLIEQRLVAALGGYGVGPAATQAGFCVPAALEHAGLDGAVLMARNLASA